MGMGLLSCSLIKDFFEFKNEWLCLLSLSLLLLLISALMPTAKQERERERHWSVI